MNKISGYLLRVLIALDQLAQAISNKGLLGVTISARSGTAQAHEHEWGCVLCGFLDRAVIRWYFRDKQHSFGFGIDPVTGKGHCQQAIEGDIARAKAVLASLQDDNTVTTYYAGVVK